MGHNNGIKTPPTTFSRHDYLDRKYIFAKPYVHVSNTKYNVTKSRRVIKEGYKYLKITKKKIALVKLEWLNLTIKSRVTKLEY